MVNKLSIDTAYRQDPYKKYYVIQNPKIDTKKKKGWGLSEKTVAYHISKLEKDFIYFEKSDKTKNKRFPDTIEFDKRYPDAENEVLVDPNAKEAKRKKKFYDSYAIFFDQQVASYNKLIRLHRLAEQMVGIHAALVEAGENEMADGMSLDNIKNIFSEVQETGYFDKLERIQIENPGLAAK